MVDEGAELSDDDRDRIERWRAEPEHIEQMRAEIERAKTEPPTPPGPGLTIGVFAAALVIYLLISIVPRSNRSLLGVVGFLVACPTAWVLTRDGRPESESGPQRHTGLWAFALLCLMGRALPALRRWDGFGVAVAAAAILATGYVVVNRLRLRRWSRWWDGGLLGAAKRWAGVGHTPDEAGPRRWSVPPRAVTRLGLYLAVIFGFVGWLTATIADRADISVVAAVLALGDFDSLMQRRYGLGLGWRRWFTYFAGVIVGVGGPALIAWLLGAPVDRHAWWLVAAVPVEIALGIAGYVLVTHLPVRHRALDSI